MNSLFKTAALFLIFCTLSCTGNNIPKRTSHNATDDYSERINRLIETEQPRLFNGVISITKGGEVKYTKEHGYSDFSNKTPISINDKFRIMSNSKQITAVLILKEVGKGRVDLHQTIEQYLPDLKSDWRSQVTVHHLLNMSSGIVDINKPLLFEPGTSYRYSNPGYGLLGRIIEAVTGQEFSIVAGKLFTQLDMHDTSSYSLGGANPGLISGYWLENE